MGGTDCTYEFYMITMSYVQGFLTQYIQVGQMFKLLSSIAQLSLNCKQKDRSRNLQSAKVSLQLRAKLYLLYLTKLQSVSAWDGNEE